ncbi:MAG TPA: patatin-like phospholipase family protein [Candidatus Acidoferrum sp.]|nr:patatin-like phospholipase family protein [Candidatus Acidoferrum sp.]
MRRVVFVFSFLLLLLPLRLRAQQELPPRTRPKIGVALEGGGAMGLAHIGVLKWFEEHHVPVDYVAGTSMGGLVGGFYATGMNPEEMKALIEGLDWRAILSDHTPYEDLSYRRKEDQRAYPNSLIFGLRGGLSLPAGLNAGHQIGLLIDRVTLPYYGITSYDEMPIPFRCVAADLVSGKSHVFRDGPLAVALRSTMSIPGAFAPVHEGNAVFVDGGLLDNLPTDVVRQMGAEIVIAIHLEEGPVEAKNIKSVFSVLDRSVSVVIEENELHGLAQADAIVTVPLNEFTTVDYAKRDAIMQRGYEAAKDKMRLLEAFALGNADWDAYLETRNARKRSEAPSPQFLKIEGASEKGEEYASRYLKAFVGKPLDTGKLDEVLTRLTGVGRYDSAGYQLTQENGKPGLLIRVVEKTDAPPMFQTAFEVDGSQAGNVDFTMGTRFTFMDVAGYRSEWRTDLLLGNTYGLQTELYRPFTAESRWFFAPHADASDTAFPIYAKNDPLADYRIYRINIGGDVGYGFGRFSELRAGYEIGSLNIKLRLGSPEIPAVEGRIGQAHLHYLLDDTDDPVIPRRGFKVETNFRWFDQSPAAKGGFSSMDLKLGYFQPVAQPASVFLEGEGGTTFGWTRASTGIPQFFLGAPLSLSAYGQNEFQGNQYYLVRAGYMQDLLTLPPFVGKKVYAVGAYEIGKMYGVTSDSELPNDVVAGFLAETALGPFFIGGSVGDSGHRKWFFQLGRVF